MHLRREEEVISADDGHAESGRSAEEGAQRVAAAHLGAGGDDRRGRDACMSSKLPTAYASRAANGGERVWQGQRGPRMAKEPFLGPSANTVSHRACGRMRVGHIHDFVDSTYGFTRERLSQSLSAGLQLREGTGM